MVSNQMLCFDLRPEQNAIQGDAPKESDIPMAVMWGNRVGGNWLMKWDEQKNSHGTLIDWCTGREWPLNCMTVISAWWRLSIRFQRSSGRRQVYNSIEFDEPVELSVELRAVGSWVEDRTEFQWRRDVVGKATPGRRGLGPWWIGVQRRCSKESQNPAEWTPGLRLSIRRTRKTQRDGHKSEVKIFQLCSVSSSLSHTILWTTLSNPCNKVRGIYFVKEVFLRLCHWVRLINLLRQYVSCMNMYMCTSSSSYRAGSTDIPDPLSPLLPIVHRPM